jgi:hypothetical protein
MGSKSVQLPLSSRLVQPLAAWHGAKGGAASSLRTAAALLPALSLASGCASLRPRLSRAPSHAIAPSDLTTLGRVFGEQSGEQPGLSGFQVVTAAHAAFAARAALADAAQRTLDLQYHSAADDLTSDLLLLRLLAAADRGVRVRVLLDDIHPTTRIFAQRAAAAHPAVPVEAVAKAADAAARALVRESLHAGAQSCADAPPCQWLASEGMSAALRSGSVALSWARARAVYDHPDQDKPPVAFGIEQGMSDDQPSASATRGER